MTADPELHPPLPPESTMKPHRHNRYPDTKTHLVAAGKEVRIGFHTKEGLYFRRLHTGNVRITRVIHSTVAGVTEESVQSEIELTSSEWASVVAEVSAENGSAAAFSAARMIHERGVLPP